MSHYVVVGAGVAGLTIAQQLSFERHAVTVHTTAAGPGLLAVGWCKWNEMFEGANALV